MKKILLTSSIIILIISMLAGCTTTPPKGNAVMNYLEGKYNLTITESMAIYFLTLYKYGYLMNYDAYDSEEGWNTETYEGSGISRQDYLLSSAIEDMKQMLAALYLYETNNFKLSKEDKENIDLTMEAAIGYFESRGEANRTLKNEFNLNVQNYRYILTLEQIAATVKDKYIYDTNKLPLVYNDYENYYKDNYALVKIIFYNMNKNYVYEGESENSLVMLDQTTGYYLTIDFGDNAESEKAKKKALADEAWEKIQNGEDFNTVVKSYGDLRFDFNAQTPGGKYLNKNTAGTTLAKALWGDNAIEVGEVAYLQGNDGIYIIKREPLVEGAFRDLDTLAQFENATLSFDYDARSFYYSKQLQAAYDRITINEEFFANIKIVDLSSSFAGFWLQWYTT